LFRPELTVIAQPGYEVGQQAAKMLLKMIMSHRQDEMPATCTLKAELRIRNLWLD